MFNRKMIIMFSEIFIMSIDICVLCAVCNLPFVEPQNWNVFFSILSKRIHFSLNSSLRRTYLTKSLRPGATKIEKKKFEKMNESDLSARKKFFLDFFGRLWRKTDGLKKT